MRRYVKLEEAIVRCGLARDVVDALLEGELIRARPTLERETVISADEAEELRVAKTLMEEFGVNVAGVEVILHMRRQQLALQQRLDALVSEVRSELFARLRDADLLGPAGFLPPPA